jgi:uncharacterized protein YoxC
MKKLITIMLVVVLSCSSVIVAYADTTENAFDWTTAEFKFTYDDTNFYHHSDGTCDILNADGSVAYTMNKEETASKFKALKISFDSAGNIKVEQGMLYGMACGISDILGIAGSFLRATPITDRLGDLLVSSTSHSFTYEYMTNNLNKDAASVSSDGTLSLTQKGVQDIYNLLMKQYMESHGMSNFFAGQYHTDKVSELYNQAYYNAMRWFGLSESTSYSYMRAIVEAMNEQGYTYVFLTVDYGVDTQHLYFIDLDNYAYAAHGTRPGGWTGSDRYCTYFYDANFEQLNNYVAVVDLKEYAEQFDTSQNPLDYVSYEDYLFDKGRQMYNYSEDARPLWAYSSFDKMVQDVQGGATDYITSDFASGNIPSSITLSPDMLSQDWDKFTDELTDAITDALKGADSSEKQDKIDETFQRYLKKINSNIEDLNADNNKLTKKSNKLLDDILDKVKDINKDTNKYLKSIQKDYLKDLKSYCKDMKKSMSDILKNVKTIKHIEELNLLITALSDSDRDKALSDIKTDSKQVQSVLHRKFPTCVFNDAKQIFDLLSATPVAPVVTMRVGFESVGVSDMLTMDFHIFDDYIGQFRQLQELIYIFVLFRATRKMFVDGGDL